MQTSKLPMVRFTTEEGGGEGEGEGGKGRGGGMGGGSAVNFETLPFV